MSDPLSVGEHPQSRPEDGGPCPTCVGERARRAVHDAIHDLKRSRDFPRDIGDAVDFEDEFAADITRMALWCYWRARTGAFRDDYTLCTEHLPVEDDGA